MTSGLPDHVKENRRHWDETSANWISAGERSWQRTDPVWGMWQVPESEVEMLPVDMTGIDAIELGCGTGYVSAWMIRRGATVTGIDNSEQQLATAARLAEQHGVSLTLQHGNAETLPYDNQSYDFAISEYGASIWCEPEAWLREAHRVLRPGGRLVFLANHPMLMTCVPWNGADVSDQLIRPYFDLHELDWRDVEIEPGGVNSCLPISGWTALFRDIGFEVEDLREPRAPADTTGTEFFVAADWARRWPCELVWKVRKA